MTKQKSQEKLVPNMRLKDGLSGLMRTRNEAQLLSACIDSCIDALDELIVVYNDCTDNTAEVLAEKQKQYPDKLKVYAYNNKVLSFDLTREEFEEAKNLPDNSPRLYCNQCNFGLSKVSYTYVTKIDADQIYFADELKKWRDVCKGEVKMHWQFSHLWGWFFMMWFTLYRRASLVMGRPFLAMLPTWLVRLFAPCYISYAKYQLQHDKVCVALSGVNLFYDKEWFIPFDGFNIHPPYNGGGDTVIFHLTEETFFTRRISEAVTLSVTELFHCPRKMMFAGTVWFHLHANRAYCVSKVREVKRTHPELFVRPEEFVNMSYRTVIDKMMRESHTLFQLTLFALIHKIGIPVVKQHLQMLNSIRSI